MLAPNPSIRSTIFWQVVNQSLNVAVNFSNANKSIAMSPQEIGTAYLAATCTSVLIAVSLTRAVPRLRGVSPTTKALLGKLVPFVSVASAGVVNISCIRWKEMRDGVEVFRLTRDADDNEHKEVLGKSPAAGKLAVGQSAASRVFTNVPTLIIPPMVMAALEARRAFVGPRGKMLSTLANLTLSKRERRAPPPLSFFWLDLSYRRWRADLQSLHSRPVARLVPPTRHRLLPAASGN